MFFREEDYPAIDRLPSLYNPLTKFQLAKGTQKHYEQQYADIYFLRLAKLKPAVEQAGEDAWADLQVHIMHVIEVPPAESFLDRRRVNPQKKSGARCTARRTLLGRWYSVHGYAPKAEYSRRYHKRGKWLWTMYSRDLH